MMRMRKSSGRPAVAQSTVLWKKDKERAIAMWGGTGVVGGGVTGRLEFDAFVHEEATQVTEQLKHTNSRADKMAQRERTFTALAKDQVQFPPPAQ